MREPVHLLHCVALGKEMVATAITQIGLLGTTATLMIETSFMKVQMHFVTLTGYSAACRYRKVILEDERFSDILN